MRLRSWPDWSTRERWVVGAIVLVAAAVVVAQLSGDDSIGSTLTYVGFTLGIVGLALAAATVFRSSGRRQVDSGLSTTQKAMLAGGVIVLIWAAAGAAQMDGGFVLAGFVATVAIGLLYVTVIIFGVMAVRRVRSR